MKQKIKQRFCDDYSYILSTSQFSILCDYELFININKGYEKYIMLIDYYRNNECSNKIMPKNYSDSVLAEYNRIDRLNL